MKATYWHIPISKAGIKLPVAIVNFKNETDLRSAKNNVCVFGGNHIRVTDINESIC